MQDEELIARLRTVDASWSQVGEDCAAAADRIEALVRDKRWIIEERDRTFALMLARAEKAEARAERLEAKVALASEELSLIAVMGYSDDPKVAANIARMAVERAANARAALTHKDRTDG